jgi:hypothetical protein
MTRISDFQISELSSLKERMQGELNEVKYLQAAAQRCVKRIYSEFEESLVLVRFYVTIPYHQIPDKDKEFVKSLSSKFQLENLLKDKTYVLSLLGTYGQEAGWNDRYKSQGHLGIPLLSANFVESIPMVSRLMSDMKIGLDWLENQNTDIIIKSLGNMARLFYVKDAVTTVDDKNRKIVPATDFVNKYKIKTVFGLGGCYLNGMFISMIIFTKEEIDKPVVEQFMTLINTIKAATMDTAMNNMIYQTM